MYTSCVYHCVRVYVRAYVCLQLCYNTCHSKVLCLVNILVFSSADLQVISRAYSITDSHRCYCRCPSVNLCFKLVLLLQCILDRSEFLAL